LPEATARRAKVAAIVANDFIRYVLSVYGLKNDPMSFRVKNLSRKKLRFA
jgi:DMSO/TMAO reductase YedYZ molybdopterin-dependent catalytic subunit